MGEERLSVRELAELHGRLVSLTGVARWREVFCLGILATRYAEAGDVEEGLKTLASIPAEHRSAFCAPEISRIEGELLLRHSRPAEAEACFRTAIDLARQRSEKLLELRAATGLARLWQRHGRREEARRLLGDVYGWFTEGFDTADLRAAHRLLTELS
jgi:predicted ATPase